MLWEVETPFSTLRVVETAYPGERQPDRTLYQDDEIESGVCYFNGRSYPLGEYVLSGDELLRCEERGVWVRKAEMLP